jgi:Rieske 2Fe-2S family protein
MIQADRIAALLGDRRHGYSLPQAFYLDDDVFEADLEAVFGREWLFACNACEIRNAGDYLTLEVGRNSVIVLRDRDGDVRAFHNTCRHRGSRICTKEKGRASVLVCPYHQWTYGLDGALRNARQMPEDFDRSGYGLKPARVEVICGMVYVSLDPDPPSLTRFRDAVTPFIAPHQPERTKVAFESTIVEDANWKLVIENNRECYHCAAGHPELLVTFHETPLAGDLAGEAAFRAMMAPKAARWEALGLPHAAADGGNEFRCVRLPLNEGALSFTMSGALACRKLLADFEDPDLGSVRMFRAPNNWNHFLSDHIIHFRVLPLAPDKTAVRTTWLVHEDAVEGVDYDVADLTHVWTATNEQDARLAALNHLGIQSRAYDPGPYAPSEFMLNHFTDWYAGKIANLYGPPAPMRIAAE